MSKGIKYAFIFALGAGLGSAITWAMTKSKYEQIVQEQIDSVKEHYKKKYTAEEGENTDISDEESEDYDQTVMDLGYSEERVITPKEAAVMERPYVIHPADFGEHDDYDRISLSYYSDGILADEDDDIVEDVDGVVGSESLNHFGEYEDDSVYVRNDSRKVDYEILLDERRYSEVVTKKPHRVED